MPTLSDTSDHEDELDIVAEYEKRDSAAEEGNSYNDEGSGNEENQGQTVPKRVDPATSRKHIVRNPIPTLNVERLKGPKGIQTIEKYFEGFKFHGKGHEKLDLDRILKRIEHWAHRLFPKLEFDAFLEKVEKLGTKRELTVFVKKYRQDMINPDDNVMNRDIVDEDNDEKEPDEPMDEFDLLIAEQIEKQKQVINQQPASDTSTAEALFDKLLSQTSNTTSQAIKESNTSTQLSDEVKQRIEKNRQQALQRRQERLKAMQEDAERKKLRDNEDIQLQKSSNDTQISNAALNLENEFA
ncbi:uncharacterized protein LOC116426936 [Nomia melanderi]|uniref:uncharacterized protein LOC116426936 n=1 Tax=Nomia melanderi TaxID=2448451 RepID=UPI00130449DB|nr:protein TIPIN homolog [Nomia melanderi]